MQKAEVSYLFRIKSKRIIDAENLRAGTKPYIDGLVDAGVLVADDWRHLISGRALIVLDGREATEITLEELA